MKIIFTLTALILAIQSHATERRIALVIGNSNYSSPEMGRLANPVNDAQDMAKALKKLNFNVITGINLSKAQMSTKIKEFDKKIRAGKKQDTVGLFYYAGHGLEVEGKNYLIPTNAEMHYQEDASDEGIPLKRVINNLSYSNNRINIVILDACRNNPLPKRDRAIASGGWSPTVANGLFIAYGTAPGRTAADAGNNGRNGLYTKHILQNINQPGKTLSQVFRAIRTGVVIETNKKQQPGVYDQTIGGDFYFIPPNENAIASNQQTTQPTTRPTVIQAPIQTQTQTKQEPQAPEGTVLSEDGKLMWMRCSVGQTWNKITAQCDEEAKGYTFKSAQRKAKGFSYAGFNDWRVPTIEELETLVYCSTSRKPRDILGRLDGCTGDYATPTIDKSKFPNTSSSSFWSASPDAYSTNRAWNVSFSFGDSSGYYRNGYRYVRLVRFGQ